MRYKLHPKNPDGSLNLKTTLTLGRPGQHPETDGVVDSYASREEAHVSLLEALRRDPAMGAFSDFGVQLYNEADEPVEEVSATDRDAAGVDAQRLMAKNADIRMAVATMLAGRQLYAAAVSELERLLDKALVAEGGDAEKGVEPAVRKAHPLTIEVLIQASANQAAQPFNEVDLFEGMTHMALPWLQKKIEEHTKQDTGERLQEAAEAEAARRAVPLPIGIPLDKGLPPEFPREKALVLIGYGPAVHYLLDHLVGDVLAAENTAHPNRLFTVVRLSATPVVEPSANERLALVGSSGWNCCTRSKKQLGQMVAQHILPQLRLAPDLLVVDDLALAADGVQLAGSHALLGGYAPFRCADAHKRLMAWCKHSGMALVAGVPTGSDTPPDLAADASLDRLKANAVLRAVSVIRKPGALAPDLAEGKVRILVGRDAYYVDVDPGVLQLPNRIII